MDDFLIVGGGLSGISAAILLRRYGRKLTGSERSSVLGGRAHYPNQKFFRVQTQAELTNLFSNIQIEECDLPIFERSKNGWEPRLNSKETEQEKFLLSPCYLLRALNLKDFPPDITELFKLRTNIVSLFPSKKMVVFQDGTETFYSKLIWTDGLMELKRVWKEDKTPLLKLLAKFKVGQSGIFLDWHLKAPLWDGSGTFIFPFRFRDEKLRAIGFSLNNTGENRIQWSIFLSRDLAEDKEEVAKRLKAFRRELGKDFSNLEKNLTSERIVFLSAVHNSGGVAIKSPEPLENIILLGTDVQWPADESPTNLDDLDLAAWNISQFGKYLALNPN